jgi:hypothetical protein
MPGFWLGRAGALQQIRTPSPDYSAPRIRLGGTHELLAGLVRDTIGYRRQFSLRFPVDLTAEQYSVLETLYELPGPYRYLDPTRRNLLTANQSSGTDALRDTTGLLARFQGTLVSDTAQARSGLRAAKWDTVTALSATNRGVYCYTSATVPDRTWAAILPSTTYTASVYARASATVSMYAAIDWMDAGGAIISTSFGSSANPGTGNWSSRFTVTATSPSSAAYAIPALLNQATTAGAVQVWADEWQLQEGATATTWVLGTGVPVVTIDTLEPDYSNYAADATPPLLGATMTLLEIT